MSQRKDSSSLGASPKGEGSPSQVKRELFREASADAGLITGELTIMIKVVKPGGDPLPFGSITDDLIIEMFQNAVGVIPVEVEVLGNRDALVDLPFGSAVYEIAQCIQGPGKWRDQDIKVGCVMSTRSHLMAIHKEREELREQREELEQQRSKLEKQQQESQLTLEHEKSAASLQVADYKERMNELTRRVTEQLSVLELFRVSAEQERRLAKDETGQNDTKKIMKPPHFPRFSGSDPIPKNECGIETFLFQVKGARRDVTDQAVRTALLSALRGGASAFLEYVGLDSPLDTIVEKLTERYCTQAPHDALICQFHQLVQDKGESVRDFAGRIEKIFRKLQLQVPERYPDESLLKDRLFYGMHQSMKDSLRYLYTQPTVSYTELLQASYIAEVESNRGRALRSKAARVKQGIEDEGIDCESSSFENVASKLDELSTIVKATHAPQHTGQYGGRKVSSAQNTPKKEKGGDDEGKPIAKPLQCWRCGGWGHTSRECPTNGSLEWRKIKAQTGSPKSKGPKGSDST